MSSEPDHLVLRRFADARDRGELELVAEAWEQLAINNFDRVKQIVKAFRFSAAGPGIPEDELGSAATEAYLRVVAMGASFRERELGRYYAALVTCVRNACRDFGRKELRYERHVAGSIDETFEPEGEAGRYDAALAAYDADLRDRARNAVEAERSRLEAEQLVGWAIKQVNNENYREMLELTWNEKRSAEEISERLCISLENVYARRSRGGKELERILRGLRP